MTFAERVVAMLRRGFDWITRRRRTDEDFAREIDSHIALEAERLVAEGWSAAGAGGEARRRFGNVATARERFHETRCASMVEDVMRDLRHAARLLRRAPVFGTIAILSIALGVGANTAIFTFVNAVLFKDLAVRDPERLVWVRVDERFPTTDYPTVVRFRQRESVFDAVAAVHSLDRAVVATDHETADARSVRVHLVTGDYFGLFGVRPDAGRFFSMEEDERVLDGHPVVVVSSAYRRAHFGSASDALGNTLSLNGTTFTIVGVAPPSFTGDELGEPADLWIPLFMQSAVMPERPNAVPATRLWLRMLARLKPGVSVEHAANVATAIYRQKLQDQFAGDPEWTSEQAARVRVTLHPEHRGYSPSRADAAEPMVVAWVIVGLVLLIACVNVSALMLVRAASRDREIATRLSLGASAARVARLFFAEGALVGVAASLAGVVVSVIGVRWLERVAASGVTVYRLSIAPDASVFALTIAVSLLTILVCGLVPARRALRLASHGTRGTTLLGGRRLAPAIPLGSGVIVAQVAMALVLVTGAGAFARTLARLEHQDMGFDREHLIEAFTEPEQVNLKGAQLTALFEESVKRVRALPGVQAAAASSRGFMTRYAGMVRTTVPGYVTQRGESEFVAYNYVTPGFFQTAGMSLVAGRDFTADDIEGSPRVAIVSESMARHYFGTVNALGRRYGTARDQGAPIQVIGVVRDAKDGSLRDERIEMMYFPSRQAARNLTQMRLIVRSAGDPAALVADVRTAIHAIAPQLPITSVAPIAVQMRRTIAMERFTALVSGFFGAIALLLAALGIYAMTSHAVVARTPEIGIRMAMGGTAESVVLMILRENLSRVGAGLAIGLGLALIAMRAVRAQLFDVSPTDAASFAIGIAVILAASAAAVLLPARRATRVDPAETLRYE